MKSQEIIGIKMINICLKCLNHSNVRAMPARFIPNRVNCINNVHLLNKSTVFGINFLS